MITNSASENPKSVKGSKNASSSGSGGGEGEEEKKERSYKSGAASKDYREPRGRGYYGYCGRGRGKSRGRRDDYGRGGGRFYEDRRGTFRGRNRRGRDDDSSFPRTRFQESLNKGKPDVVVSSSSSKYVCEYRNNKAGIPEDSKISSTLRRMSREDDEATFNTLCKFLQESMTLPDNEVYIRRAMDVIGESLLDMIRFGADWAKIGASSSIGHLAHTFASDVKRFLDWIFRKFNHENNNSAKEYLLKALHELAMLDMKDPKLGDCSKPLMRELHQIMESTEVPDIYMLAAQTIFILTKRHPYHFTEFFRDAIDIIVGWQIDSAVNGKISTFSSDCLRSLSAYWVQDVCFTVNLLGQLLEDAESFADEVLDPADEEPFSKATSFISVFRAVFEGAREAMDPSKCKQITWTFHSDTITRIFNIVLKMNEIMVFCPLIEAGNRCACSVMVYLRYKTDQLQATLSEYLSYQLAMGEQLDSSTLASLLALIAKVVCEPGIQVNSELVDHLFSTNSFILTLRFTPLADKLFPIYQGLLKRRDIYLIKSTYKCILTDLESAVKVISPNTELLPTAGRDLSSTVNEYSLEQVPIVISFYFDAFKHMSQIGGSLVWIYLVKPNLFELLAMKLVPVLQPTEYPALYHSLIVLLKSHCSMYGEFVSTSGLANASQERPTADGLQAPATKFSNSPTTNYLAVILNIIGSALKMVMCEDTKVIVTKWCRHVITACLKTAAMELGSAAELWVTVAGLCRAATDASRRVALASARALKSFTAHCPPQAWRKEYVIKVIRLCTFFINSPSPALQKKYLMILPLLPSLEVIFCVEQICKDPKSYTRNLEMCLYSAMNRGETGEIQEHHFRRFMTYVIHGVPKTSSKEWLAEMVYRCWAVTEFELGQRIMATERGLSTWAIWHCSQYAANGKLKTPFGKSAQTLIAIESAFRELSKEIVAQKVSKAWRWPMTGQRVRLLVDFVENLEKQIYNNTEGTASALPIPHQGIKSFFITNRATCGEWLNRIRLTVIFVCIHAGMSTYAVRHGYSFLQHLVETNNTQSGDFETGLIYTGWALCNLREGEAVRGLYAWARDCHGTKMPILKPLAQKAQRRYEDAIREFQTLLITSVISETNETSDSEQEMPSNSLRTFIADQLTDTYICINEWEELLHWKKREKDYLSEENGNSLQLYKSLDVEYVSALHELNTSEGDWCSKQLSNWKCLKVPSLSRNAPRWNFYSSVSLAEAALARVAINAVNDPVWKISKNVREKVEAWCELIDEIIGECCKEGASDLLGPCLVLKYAASSLSLDCNYLDNQMFQMEGSLKKKLGSPELSRLLWWLTALQGLTKRVPKSNMTENIWLQMCRIARKEGNSEMARICLVRQLKEPITNSLVDIGQKVISSVPNPIRDNRVLTELAKQLHGEGDKYLAAEVALVSTSIGEREARSRSLARAARWITTDDLPERLSERISVALKSAEASANSVEAVDLAVYMKGMDNPTGRLLAAAASAMPSFGKAWESLAGWALDSAGSAPINLYSPAVPSTLDPKAVAVAIAESPPKIDLDDIDMDGSHGLKAFLNKVAEMGDLTVDEIDSLVSEWRTAHVPLFNFFSLAAYAYFKFLHHQPAKGSAVLATLRLVRLLCHHPAEMEPLYQIMMPLTPTDPWISVAPQLFSRLSHPHPYPRRKTAELLVRIGTDFPHLITFPAIVGSSTGASTIKDLPNTKLFVTNQQTESGELKDDEIEDDLKFDDEEDTETYDDDELTNKDESSSILENSFKTIVDSLSKQRGGEMLSEVSIFVAELRRITVLWDELWLGTLKQRYGDIVRRFNKVSAEVEVTQSNPHLDKATKDSLILEKHRLILKPLLFVLEQLHSITSVPAETPHETLFQEKFGSIIEETLKELQEPSNPKNPEVAYSALKRLEKTLSQASESGGKPMVYNMSDISPILAKMKDTMISMPGQLTSSITIVKVINTVPVLATMTKPKKLVFVGSDGKEYTYLFKGLEDLHLDERIMQFLSTANRMLPDPLRAVHYSVVPLGPRSGLISWVDSVTPIFSIYKRWQHNQAKPGGSGAGPSGVRPSELYYSALTPLLQEIGLKADPQHRTTWPLYILKKALALLTSQTPPCLLSKEMWCMSGSCGSWWEATKLYSTSLAVMSVIGYIIGLGDRHLDNIMVNLRTGQVVHIDYNVCFEKGKTLRVPEKVPFRLTPNLVNALGVTGVEGLFRLTCEKVLEVMQKEKETLLTLLEAFVYDPLIDWTPMHEAGYTGAVYGGGRGAGHEMKLSRRQLEREVTLAMYSVLVVEISHEWNANKCKVETELSEFIRLINNWLESNHKLGEVMSQLQERHSQMAYLKEAEGQSQHALFTLGTRYEKYRNTFGVKLQVTTSLKNIIEESDIILTHYQRAVDMLRLGEIAKWRVQVTSRPTQDICAVFDLIKEFLQNAGQGNTVNQCMESESAISRICSDVSEMTLVLTDLLLRYWEIAENYPPSYIMSHRSRLFKQWALMLLEDMSKSCCTRVGYELSSALAVTEEEVILRSSYYSDLLMLGSNPPPIQPLPPVETFDPINLTNLPRNALAAGVIAEIVHISTAILKLESATVGNSGSGEVLASLMTPQDVDEWFLEDAVALTGALRELVCILPTEKDSSLYFAARLIGIIHSKYKSLQMLDLNVRSIIVNEAVRLAKVEDSSVLSVALMLENAVSSARVPPRDLVEALTSALSQVMNGSELSDADKAVVGMVEMVEGEVNTLLAALESKTALTSGEMLLLGFAGLFAPLVPPPGPSDIPRAPDLSPPWNGADIVIGSFTYAVQVSSACERGTVWQLVSLLFAASRIAAMTETLALCRGEAAAWATACRPPVDPALLAVPTRAFINHSVQLRLAGMAVSAAVAAIAAIVEEHHLLPGEIGCRQNTSGRLSIDEIGHKVLANINDSARAQECMRHMGAAVRWQLSSEHRDQEAAAARANRGRMAIARTTYHWMYEQLLAGPVPSFNRPGWSVEVGNAIMGLYSVRTAMKEALEHQEALVASVEQRLRWAAGANPALNEVMSAFEESVRSFREKVDQEMALAAEAANLANCLVQYEGLRVHNEDTVAADRSFALLVKECLEAYNASCSGLVRLTNVEEGLTRLCPPPATVTQEWITMTEAKLSEVIQHVTEEVDPLQKDLFAAEDCIKNKAMVLRFEMSRRNRIVSDIRQLFKTMVKFEEASENGLECYLDKYKEYTDRMSKMTKRFTLPEAFGERKICEVLADAEILLSQTDDVYDSLLKFSFKNNQKEHVLSVEVGKKNLKKLVHTKSVQEKNSYAVGVWRKIKMKLEGRDPDPGVRSSVHHQVRWAIDEAMSVDNLATLYEGWTPWV